jgi:putative Holliday junction resolvase
MNHKPETIFPSRILGLDVGGKRIGVAVSDPLGITAQPLEVVARDGQGSEWKRFPQIMEEYKPQKIVMGLPKNMNGSEGEQAGIVRLFAKTFSRKFAGIEIVFQDERLSTAASERLLLEAGVRREKRRQKRDVIAAALILQTFLDSRTRK